MQQILFFQCILWPQARTQAIMQNRSCSAASVRVERDDAPLPLAGSTSELVKASGQFMIGELLVKVQAELKLVREDMNKLSTKPTKVLDHV